MNIISAYHKVGTYRGAAELCSTTHKTVKRVIERRLNRPETLRMICLDRVVPPPSFGSRWC